MPFMFKLSRRLSRIKAVLLAPSVALMLGCEITEPPPSPPLADVAPAALPVVAVTASDDDGNVPQNTIDNNLATRWSANGDGQWIRYDLGSVMTVNRINIAWYLGDARVSYFDIEVATDTLTWTKVLSGRSSGATPQLEGFDFPATPARYLRIVGHMNSTSAWNSITEVAFGSVSDVPVSSVTASDDDGDVPENTIDRDLSTRWSADGDGQWVRYDLGASTAVAGMSVAWYLGDERVAAFDIEVSPDAATWTRVLSGKSSGLTIQPERYDFASVSARFVRLVGHMNSSSSWNSITEVTIHPPGIAVPLPPPAPTVALTADVNPIKAGQPATLSWTAMNATGCTASDGWTGTRPVTGQATVTPVTNTTYSISCSGDGGTTTRNLAITVLSALAVTAVTASANDGNVPQNTVDNNLATRWSASGDGQWIRYDLGSVKTINAMNIAWYLGDARSSSFDVDASPDGAGWSHAFSGKSSGQTIQLERYDFPAVTGRYVRIVGHGNSSSSWNSITEVAIQGTTASPPVAHGGHYVSPSGTASGDGSMSAPWDLQTALNQPASVVAGDTIWLRAGTYGGQFTSNLRGTATAPIIVRQYPGERATIDGAGGTPLLTRGSYTWFWGFEVTNSNPTSGSGMGINIYNSIGDRFINLVVHDASKSGFASFSPNGARQTVIHGSLSYNNGHEFNLDHGMYLQNAPGTGTVEVSDNIVFNNLAWGIHIYGQSPEAISGFRVEGNVVFGNGSISVPVNRGNAILIGGAVPASGIIARNNYTYWPVAPGSDPSRWSMNLGYTAGLQNSDLVAENNYIVGGLYLGRWSTASIRNNLLYDYAGPLVMVEPGLGGQVWSANQFYGDPGVRAWTALPNGATTLTTWLSQTGLTTAGAYAGTLPANLVAVRPNQYEAGRANIIVYNWTLQGSVSVDLSRVLQPGDRYVVQNAQNFYGASISSGTYGGGNIQLPMAGVTPAAPIGRTYNPAPATGPTFQVFVVMRTS